MIISRIFVLVEFGVRIQPLVATGKLVPSELLVPLVESEIEKLKSSATTGILLDGKAAVVRIMILVFKGDTITTKILI